MERRPKILIVDDEPDMVSLISTCLAHLDCDTRSATSGVEALEQIDLDPPDVILTDVIMPKLDGFEFVKMLKSRESTRDIPVIMVTALADIEDKVRALNSDIHDLITKPLNKAELIARVHSVLRLKMEIDRRKAREAELNEANILLRKANVELERLSFNDGLTGVSNRRYFDDHFMAEWKRAARNKGHLGLIMADIDYFKLYNDTYGHQQGDECLKQVALAAAGALRRPGELLARYGGEEFVAVLPDANLEETMTVAKRLSSRVSNLDIQHESSSCEDHVTVSLGICSVIPDPESEAESLIEAADRALYRSKADGRNRISVAEYE